MLPPFVHGDPPSPEVTAENGPEINVNPHQRVPVIAGLIQDAGVGAKDHLAFVVKGEESSRRGVVYPAVTS